MKTKILIIACLILSVTAFSQPKKNADSSHMKTVFGNCSGHFDLPFGYFIEANAAYTKFGHKDVFLPGISMGIILNHHWTLGGSMSMVGNSLNYHHVYTDSVTGNTSARLSGGYGGMLLEYTLLPNSVVHVRFPLIIGGGYMQYTEGSSGGWENHSFSHNMHQHAHVIGHDQFFVIEPGVTAEFNLIKHLRLGIGVSYRYSPNFDLINTSTGLLNQFNAKLSLRFGKF
jgi:hypothetical protein